MTSSSIYLGFHSGRPVQHVSRSGNQLPTCVMHAHMWPWPAGSLNAHKRKQFPYCIILFVVEYSYHSNYVVWCGRKTHFLLLLSHFTVNQLIYVALKLPICLMTVLTMLTHNVITSIQCSLLCTMLIPVCKIFTQLVIAVCCCIRRSNSVAFYYIPSCRETEVAILWQVKVSAVAS